MKATTRFTKSNILFKILLICLQLHSPLKNDTTTLNKTNVINYLNHSKIKYKDVAYAQILIESNSFKSKLCKQKHNLFGMHCTTKRPSTALKISKGYATYKNWQASIDDYQLFQERLFARKQLTKQQYLDYLNKNFAAIKHYGKIIKKLITKLKPRDDFSES